MPNITFLEPGTDATGDFSFFELTTGTVTSDTTVSKTGPRSIKFASGAGSTFSEAYRTGVLADAGRRVSFWFRIDTLPAASTIIFYLLQSNGATVHRTNLETNGTVKNFPLGPTAVTGTKVLAINTWYRISVDYIITNTTTFTFKIYIDGVLDSTVNSGTLTRTATDAIDCYMDSTVGANVNCWFDSVYVDAGTDQSDPGNVLVTAKKPAANNTNNFNLAIGANPANRWTNVNEVPLSETNGWEESILADTQENYTLEAAGVGDVNISSATILGRTAWIWAKATTGGLGTPKIMDNGTETAIVLTSASKLFTVITTSASYPSNAAGIGARSTNNADPMFFYECGTIIAYYPGIKTTRVLLTKVGM